MRTSAAFLLLALGLAALAGPPPVKARRAEPAAAPDLLFFSSKVAADLHSRCASCHSDPELAGRYLLQPLDDLRDPDARILKANFRASLEQLDPANPGESPLLTHALGGNGHPGGALYSSDRAADYVALLHFALGATLSNRPPEAIVQRRLEGVAGEPVRLDGGLSGDPEGGELAFRWRVVERPPGSRASVEADDAGETRLVPDRGGVYRVELAVSDGELWSLPATVLVVAAAPAAAEPSAPAAEPAADAPRAMHERRLDPHRLRLIRRLFFDLKWRSPRLDDIASWYERSHEELVDAFLADEEAWAAWYEQQLFYFLLLDQFRPKEGRITTLPARLTKGEVDPARAIEEIVRSQYFNSWNPGNDTFVTVVLEQCLGLVVQERRNQRILEDGKKMYDGYRTKLFGEVGDSQADLVKIVFAQPGFFRHLLGRLWKDLHGTDCDPKRLDPWVERCTADRTAVRAVLRERLVGPDYVEGAKEARTKGEVPYVRALFVDTLGRPPTYDELRNVRNAFLSLADPTPIRLVMGRVLLESQEARMPGSILDPERFVQEQFLRLFARQPTEKEREAFIGGLKSDPRVTPRVVLWTLISSPEYQTY